MAEAESGNFVPMEVLCLGLSLADALPLLGYRTIYHMREVYKNGHGPNWVAAFESKFGNSGLPLGKDQFEQFLGPFSGVSDIPAAIFYREFMDAYPHAKIILTTREEEKWLASMKKSMWSSYRDPEKVMSPVAALMRKHVWGDEPEELGMIKFRAHNAAVLQEAKKRGREVLVYEVKQGWGPLCKFLGKEVPESTEFPNSDDFRVFNKSVVDVAAT